MSQVKSCPCCDSVKVVVRGVRGQEDAIVGCLECGVKINRGWDGGGLPAAIAAWNYRPQASGDTSDGYHTFDELYEHRALLLINWLLEVIDPFADDNQKEVPCWVADHYPGWDLVFYNSAVGQVSYHIARYLRPLYEGKFKQVQSNDEFDGHVAKDVAFRLKSLILRHGK